MTAGRIAWYAAVATAIVWTLKALAIWEAGGLNKTDLEDLGWALGFLLYVVTWATLGYAVARGRAVWMRVVAAVVGVVVGVFVFGVLDSAADVLPESAGWVHEEAGLWAAAILTLALTWWQLARERRGLPG